MDIANINKYIFKVKILHTLQFKNIFSVLKDIVSDVELIFYKNNKSDYGIYICAFNNDKTIGIYIKIVDCFYQYIFNENTNTVSVALNTKILSKIFKFVDNDDILTIKYKYDDREHLYIKTNNDKTNIKSYNKLKLLNLSDIEILKPSDLDCEVAFSISSVEFNKTCKDLSNFTNILKITCSPTYIKFSTVNHIKKNIHINNNSKVLNNSINRIKIYKYSEDKEILKIITNTNESIKSMYNIEHINLFNKCYSFSKKLNVYIKRPYLILNYNLMKNNNIYIFIHSISI